MLAFRCGRAGAFAVPDRPGARAEPLPPGVLLARLGRNTARWRAGPPSDPIQPQIPRYLLVMLNDFNLNLLVKNCVPDSHLALPRQLISLRRNHRAFTMLTGLPPWSD
jgi:hypothetical protein